MHNSDELSLEDFELYKTDMEDEFNLANQLQYVAMKTIFYRASVALSAGQLAELNSWMQEQADPDFGSMALNVDKVTPTLGRPGSVLTVNFAVPASLGLVNCVVALIDWWARNTPPSE